MYSFKWHKLMQTCIYVCMCVQKKAHGHPPSTTLPLWSYKTALPAYPSLPIVADCVIYFIS